MEKKTKCVVITQHNYVTRPNEEEEFDPEGFPHHYIEYTPAGDPLKEIHYGHAGEFEDMFVYGYDDRGKLISETYYLVEDEIAEEKTYFRDDAGVIGYAHKKYQDGSLDTITFEYNGDGKLVKRVTTTDDGEVEETELFEWDGDELVKHVVLDADGDPVEGNSEVQPPNTHTEITRNETGQVILEKEANLDGQVFMTVSRTYMEDGSADEVEVFYDGRGNTMSRHYLLKYSYTYFD